MLWLLEEMRLKRAASFKGYCRCIGLKDFGTRNEDAGAKFGGLE